MGDLQRTNEWFAARRGLPSASGANRMVTPTGKPSAQHIGYAYELAADIWINDTSSAFAGNAWTERGTELEPTARMEAALALDVDIVECGVILSPCGRYCASPDGLVSDNAVVEIKCLKHSNHVSSLMHVYTTGEPPPDYANQIRMQMLVSGREQAYFVAYHPDLPLVTCTLTRDSSAEAVLLDQIERTIAARDAALAAMTSMTTTLEVDQ